jgi:prepilin-type N-terminal cleavage/methylation domain-containing protein
MTSIKMRSSLRRIRRGQSGFSLLEMMLATIILLVGLVAVAQLVPASILLNYRNRTDSSALVFAQRELDQMLDQPLSSTSFTDALSHTCNLGNPTPTNSVQGTTVVPDLNNQPLIDFTSTVAGYHFNYPDPTDPNGTTYDVRWAVIVTGSGGSVSSKRFILGVRQVGGNGYFQPVTLDTMVEK